MWVGIDRMSEYRVSELYYYPVKSLRGISTDELVIERQGPVYDRRWMVVDENNHFLTQRQAAAMALFKAEFDLPGGLILSFADTEPCRIDIEVSLDSCALRSVTIWNDIVQAHDMGDDAAQWLSKHLNRQCRLVFISETTARQIDTQYGAEGQWVGFADGFPELLIGQGSLVDLNDRLDDPITMARFRPNIVFTGGAAFDEDSWQLIRIGNILFDVVKPCARCAIPNINPFSGEKGCEPWRTLASYRKVNKNIYFGQNLIHQSVGIIRVGDELEVLHGSLGR